MVSMYEGLIPSISLCLCLSDMSNLVGKAAPIRDAKSETLSGIEKMLKGWEVAQRIQRWPHRCEDWSANLQNLREKAAQWLLITPTIGRW